MRTFLNSLKGNILEIILSICIIILGFLIGREAVLSQTRDKENFTNIVEERDFLLTANQTKWKLIRMYDKALNAKDPAERASYIHKIDSLYNLEQ